MTCSTGGIRRAGAARERAARTICSGCPMPWRPTSAAPATIRVLDEVVPFLEAPPLEPNESEAYSMPSRLERSDVDVRALRPRDRSLDEIRRARPAAHRLRRLERRHEPRRPRGTRRKRVARLVPRRRAERVRARSATSAIAASSRSATATRHGGSTGMLELAWDGDWYRRAYFDDGTPLGSAQNDECRIDSLTQSWAVLSRTRRNRGARRGRWKRCAHISCAATRSSCCC